MHRYGKRTAQQTGLLSGLSTEPCISMSLLRTSVLFSVKCRAQAMPGTFFLLSFLVLIPLTAIHPSRLGESTVLWKVFADPTHRAGHLPWNSCVPLCCLYTVNSRKKVDWHRVWVTQIHFNTCFNLF